MTDDEAAALRDGWESLLAQYERWSSRLVWLAENEGHPEWQARSEATERSGVKLAGMQDDLAELAGVTRLDVCDLMGEVMRRKLWPEDLD